MSISLKYSIKEDINYGPRKTMEDFTLVVPDLLGDGRYFLAVDLDGHGGDIVPRKSKELYGKILKNQLIKDHKLLKK